MLTVGFFRYLQPLDGIAIGWVRHDLSFFRHKICQGCLTFSMSHPEEIAEADFDIVTKKIGSQISSDLQILSIPLARRNRDYEEYNVR